MKHTKRILSVTIKHLADSDPDISYLGEFGNSADSQFAIEHDAGRNSYRWFNPGSVEDFNPSAEWLAKYPEATRREEWHKAMTANAKADYNRMCSYSAGCWDYVGIRAEAEVQLTGDLCQRVTSGGLWGIESDSGEDYLAEVSGEELGELRSQLAAMGFSKRAIAAAFRNVDPSERVAA